jgi:hypothetical protein
LNPRCTVYKTAAKTRLGYRRLNQTTNKIIPQITKRMLMIVAKNADRGKESFLFNASADTLAKVLRENKISVMIMYNVVAILISFFDNHTGFNVSCQYLYETYFF